MLCTLVDTAFDGPDWTFEPKFDGLRILARFDGRNLTLLSRNARPQEARFPEIAEGLRAALSRPAIVDGEVVCLDESGKTSFRALQQRFHLDDPAEIRRRMEEHPAFFYLFDILYLDGADLRRRPLSGRREVLRDAVAWSDRVRLAESEPGRGIESWRRACEAGEEGIVGKRLDSPYLTGRSDAWVKIKCVGRQEFAVGGWTDPQRSRVGLGALLVGYYEGDRFHFAGKVGTGYTREVLLDLRRRFDAMGPAANPFDEGEPPGGEGVHWVRPELVAEIAFAEWTQNGLLRQPRYEGLRPDKSAGECRRERPKSASTVGTGPTPGAIAMPLEEYNAKRDFEKTREPAGARGKKSHKRPIFVVQEHHASIHHFDFRLEADGVLKSWSVPKGPSLDPSVKRLAVQVEDHPVGYATFEGTIPEGEYGGGTVAIWDHGTYESLMGDKPEPRTVAEAIDDGRLEFVMHGDRLKGKFTLIRMKWGKGKKPQWLLMKSRDEFAEAGGEPDEPKPKPKPKPKRARVARPGAVQPEPSTDTPGRVELTHPDRVMYPDAGLTKADVFAYYTTVAGHLLPFLKDRPVTLERLPDGLGEGSPRFWQKDTPASYPRWIPRVELKTERGKAVHYALVDDEPTLLYLVNQGALTFHVWASRVSDLDRPDFVLFDLDPGAAPFADVVAVARAIKAALDGLGVDSFVKTSGKTGLHILTPWTRKGGFDEARAWALELAETVAEGLPDRATVEIRKAKRGGRVYIDVMQNARGHHAVPPYVLRAVPGATISTPLDWKEVTGKLDPGSFTAKKVLARLRKADPMADFAATFAGKKAKR